MSKPSTSPSVPRPGQIAPARKTAIASKDDAPPSLRRVPPRPVVPRPASVPPPALTADAVVEFLSKLAAEDLAALLARVKPPVDEVSRVAALPPEPPAPVEPPPTFDEVSRVSARPTMVNPAQAAQPMAAPRETLTSTDLEMVAEPEPPPLPVAAKRATPTPPAPSVPPAPPSAPARIATPVPPAPIAARAPTPVPAPVSAPPPVIAPPLVIAEPPPVIAAPLPVAAPPRASMPEATELLFDAMHDLSFFDTAVEGGSFCVATAMRVVPCLAGMVHLHDADPREFVTVYARGPRAEKLLLGRIDDRDALIARASRSASPLVVRYGEGGEQPNERHALFGDPWSAIIVPLVQGGRVLGAIELVDPLDGAPFDDVAVHALKYIAEHYGQFIADRGIELGNVVAPPAI